jgi:hypothetical protein
MDREFGRPDYDPDDQGTFDSNLVFTIMPFAAEMDEVYVAIKEECEKLGLHAHRTDENTGSAFVIREITDLIERAEFIVCDLSDERPNVYYELGYAHGVGNESNDILLVARQGLILHFDIAPLRVNYYRGIEQLRSIIYANSKRMIELTRGN